MENKFKPGDKVIYIDWDEPGLWLQRGNVYTIEKLSVYQDSIVIYFEDVNKKDNAYRSDRFILATELLKAIV